MKPIDAIFEIPVQEGVLKFRINLHQNSSFFKMSDPDNDSSMVSLDDGQLDSLENCFYAMYLLIRNSKD